MIYIRKSQLTLLTCLLILSACQGQASTPQPVATDAVLLIETQQVATQPAATVEPLNSPEIIVAPDVVNGVIALDHLKVLSDEIGARFPGSEQEAEAAQYIQNAFEEMGYETEVQPFTLTNEDEEELNSQNVIAIKPGQSTQTIVVGAHYDSGDEANGADDNASGVAAMLEAAEMLFDVQTPYTIVFAAFGSEENDLDGSYAYMDELSEDEISDTIVMINLDSLIAGDISYVYGDAGPGTMHEWIVEMASENGLALESKTALDLNNEDGSLCECSDYDVFQKAGIPFVYFESTNWNLGQKDGMTQVDPGLAEAGVVRHTQFDTVDAITELFPGRIEQQFNLYVTLLYKTLTEFQYP